MIEQSAVFAAHVLLILAVFTWVGVSLVRLLPAPLAARPVYAAAPLGFALTTAWMGLLTELGVSGWLSGGTLLAAATVANAIQGARAMRAVAAAPRGTLLRPLAITLGLTLLACAASCIMVFHGSGVQFGDPWGSGDYFFYWFAGDYISVLGGAPSGVGLQQQFAHDIAWGLFGLSFRPGSYAPLDLFLWFGPSGALDHFLLPLLTAYAVLILLTLRLLLDVHQVRSTLPLLLVGLSPLNSFGLRYTYVAQYAAAALLLFTAAGLDSLAQAGPHRRTAPWMVGLVLLAGILCYDNQLFPLGVLMACHAAVLALQARFQARASWREALRTTLRVYGIPVAILAGGALLFASRILGAIRFFASQRPLPGWEWTRLPGPHDVLGLSGPYPVAGPALPLAAEVALFAVAAGLCLIALRGRLRSPGVVAALAAQSAQLLIALFFYRSGVGNASHAVWKALTLISILIPFLCGVAVMELGERLRPKAWQPVAVALLLLVAGLQLGFLWRLEPFPAWYNRELVELVRRNVEQRDLVLSIRDTLYIAPVVQRPDRSRLRVVSQERRAIPPCTPESVAVWDSRLGKGGTVLDEAGPYRVGLPPRMLDFPSGQSGTWVLWGLEPQAGGAHRLGDTAAVLLGAPGPGLALTAQVLGTAPGSVRVKVSVDGTPLGEAVFDTLEPRTLTFQVPPAVLERCRSLGSVQFDPVPEAREQGGTPGGRGSRGLGLVRLEFQEGASRSGIHAMDP